MILDHTMIKKIIQDFSDRNNGDEEVVKTVFEQHTGKTYKDILIKVIVLNQLYSAGLNDNKPNNKNAERTPHVDIRTMAKYIEKNPPNGTDDVSVRTWVSNAASSFAESNAIPYSFLTKYCAWSFPDRNIPIVDSYVKKMMIDINKQESYFSFKGKVLDETHSKNYYQNYCQIFDALAIKHFQGFSYKEIDMFLWQKGKEGAKAQKVQGDKQH